MKNTKLPQGFTLIEIAIVVAVITVLALVAYPIYSHYTKKDKVVEGIALAATAKIAVTHYAAGNDIPLTSVWTPPALTNTVVDVGVHLTDTTGISVLSHGQVITNLPARHSGEIVITFSPEIAPVNHNELILSPRQADPTQVSNGHELPLGYAHTSKMQPIIWECNSATPPTINRGTPGNLDAKLAPADCRA